jgi:hypothetical protein
MPIDAMRAMVIGGSALAGSLLVYANANFLENNLNYTHLSVQTEVLHTHTKAITSLRQLQDHFLDTDYEMKLQYTRLVDHMDKLSYLMGVLRKGDVQPRLEDRVQGFNLFKTCESILLCIRKASDDKHTAKRTVEVHASCSEVFQIIESYWSNIFANTESIPL